MRASPSPTQSRSACRIRSPRACILALVLTHMQLLGLTKPVVTTCTAATVNESKKQQWSHSLSECVKPMAQPCLGTGHRRRTSQRASAVSLVTPAAAAAPATAPLARLGLALIEQGQLAQNAAAQAVLMRQLMQTASGPERRGDGRGMHARRKRGGASQHGHSFCAACHELEEHDKLRWQQSKNNNVQGTRRGQAPNTRAQS